MSIDSHHDYGVVHCDTPDPVVRKAVAVFVVEEEAPREPDLVVSLEEAEAASPAMKSQPLPEPEIRDQPRPGPAKPKVKSRKRRAVVPQYND